MIRSVPRPAKATQRSRPPKPRLTDMELCAWVAQAEAGERLEYHRGFLARDTYRDSSLGEADRAALVCLANRARWAAEKGLVHLVQHRHGPDDYSYLAVAQPKPKAAEVSLAALLVDAEAA